jgi:hypothetical protein
MEGPGLQLAFGHRRPGAALICRNGRRNQVLTPRGIPSAGPDRPARGRERRRPAIHERARTVGMLARDAVDVGDGRVVDEEIRRQRLAREFADSLASALAVRLLTLPSHKGTSAARVLPAGRLRHVIEYIEAHLDARRTGGRGGIQPVALQAAVQTGHGHAGPPFRARAARGTRADAPARRRQEHDGDCAGGWLCTPEPHGPLHAPRAGAEPRANREPIGKASWLDGARRAGLRESNEAFHELAQRVMDARIDDSARR